MKRLVRYFAGIAVIAALLGTAGAWPAQAASVQDSVASLVNSERAAVGAASLVRDAQMDAAAQEWANTQASQRQMMHSTTQWRSARIPANWTIQGENVAAGYPTAERVMSGWMGSTGHRENILRKSFTRIGVGYSADGNYWVQIFAGYASNPAAPVSSPPTATPQPSDPSQAVVGGRTVTIGRITGADRYAVANGISQRGYPSGATTVFVATGANYPDALSAAPAATASHGPLLLTASASLPDSVRAELVRLRPDRIIVVGGENSVSWQVVSQLQSLAREVVRVAGDDRFEASRAVADYVFGDNGAATAYLATGTGFADALSAGSAAGSAAAPLILVDGGASRADDDTLDLFSSLGTRTVKIVGGPASITPAFASSVGAVVPGQVRLGGADRFAASVSVNRDAFTTSDTVYLATGYNFPDALAGAALAGKEKAPLFIVPSDCVPRGVLQSIESMRATKVVLLGGPASLSVRVASLQACVA
ncbi:putative cell wall binding repeat protein [Glaciihabitans tibetensis]|uniref:Putative cell wall binding repeat protein n=1 Tax=Glaciihabitans tibetensis TaxID=1266600 RepID=A0A2T0VFA3_9MICO|nr:cell wall-binding repeat-containing protein [Glaciihabitans tibetensis]PRY68890.1 putative cell wall binding repeat protein [Glaciihabitans tibetensis]